MAERFKRLYQLENDLYCEGNPVIISAGALLLDNESGRVLAQLKFKNVSSKIIKALKLRLSAYDVSGAELQGVDDYQYLDLCIGSGREFGSGKAVLLPDSNTRSFEISGITVIYENDTQWRLDDDVVLTRIPYQQPLSTELDDEQIKQYRIKTVKKAEFIPMEYEGLWLCTCGEINSSHKCTACYLTKDDALAAYDIDALNIAIAERLEKERVKREQEEEATRLKLEEEENYQEELRNSKEAKKNQRTKNVRLAIIAATTIAALSMLLLVILRPQNSAADNRFDGAMTVLTSPYGGYSDEKIYDALSVVMTTGLERRIEASSTPHDNYNELYYREIVYAEDYLLDIRLGLIEDDEIRNAVNLYIQGWKMQEDIFVEYSKMTNISFDDIELDSLWVDGYRTRGSAIIVLHRNGIINLSDEDYGVYSSFHLEDKISKLIASGLTLSYYDEKNYILVIPMENDTDTNFKGCTIYSIWNDERIMVTANEWKSGEVWDIEFLIPIDAVDGKSGNVGVGFYIDYESVSVNK